MAHETRIKVRPTQVDTFEHLNNSAFLELFEWARWEWAADAGMDLEPLMAEQRIGPVILHLDLSFRREVVMHEVVTIRTWFDAIEGFKGIVRQDMIKEDGRLGASLRVTFVMFHLDDRRVVKVPVEMQGAFERDAAYRAELEAAKN
jgi:YbgC/YbaW family acyl-CoA thioester hydrolase